MSGEQPIPRDQQPVSGDQPSRDRVYTDDVSLIGVEADIYEAIVTLEFIGRPVRAADIASAAGMDADEVRRALGSMVERGIVNRTAGDGEPAYEPARRGWSATPEQATGPRL